MGENNVELRERVCKDMEFLGIKIDEEVNKQTVRKSDPVKLSTDDSKVLVYMIPTNEELMIARDTEALVKAKA
jgi:acetate kinase